MMMTSRSEKCHGTRDADVGVVTTMMMSRSEKSHGTDAADVGTCDDDDEQVGRVSIRLSPC